MILFTYISTYFENIHALANHWII